MIFKVENLNLLFFNDLALPVIFFVCVFIWLSLSIFATRIITGNRHGRFQSTPPSILSYPNLVFQRFRVLLLMTFWKWEKLSNFKVHEMSFITKFIFVSCCSPSVDVNTGCNSTGCPCVLENLEILEMSWNFSLAWNLPFSEFCPGDVLEVFWYSSPVF